MILLLKYIKCNGRVWDHKGQHCTKGLNYIILDVCNGNFIIWIGRVNKAIKFCTEHSCCDNYLKWCYFTYLDLQHSVAPTILESPILWQLPSSYFLILSYAQFDLVSFLPICLYKYFILIVQEYRSVGSSILWNHWNTSKIICIVLHCYKNESFMCPVSI